MAIFLGVWITTRGCFDDKVLRRAFKKQALDELLKSAGKTGAAGDAAAAMRLRSTLRDLILPGTRTPVHLYTCTLVHL